MADDLPNTPRDGTPRAVCSDACRQMDDGLLRAGLSDVAVDLATARLDRC